MTKDQQEMWNRLKEPEPIIDKYGNKEWFNRAGERHRENDQPAVIFKNGSKFWFKNGKRHRENDQPASIWANGDMSWWENGKFIRSKLM